MCLQFLQFLESSSSLLVHGLPTLGSTNSASVIYSKTIGVMNRINKTLKMQFFFFFITLYCQDSGHSLARSHKHISQAASHKEIPGVTGK